MIDNISGLLIFANTLIRPINTNVVYIMPSVFLKGMILLTKNKLPLFREVMVEFFDEI